MALVTDIITQLEIPHEVGEWMRIRRLSWRQLEQASDCASDMLMGRMKRLGSDILSALKTFAGEQEQDVFARYDRATVLRLGIVSWSYDAEVNIDALDETTAIWACREILSLSCPRAEGETKNG